MIKVYASRDSTAFPPGQPVREHGGFYVATSQGNIDGAFDIIAEVDDEAIYIKHNSATIGYDDLCDLMAWATQ